jgi:predicted nucleic acid-binding protein
VIGYLDTSAVVPLLISEPSSPSCRRFWNDADAVVTSRLTYVEAAAALAQARRLDRITDQVHRDGLALLDQVWAQVQIVEADQIVVSRAAALARQLALRGYDAVQCAAAESVRDENLVAASGDQELQRAWAGLGLASYDTTRS